MTVRIGEPRDFEALYALLLPMHAESALFPLSEAKTKHTLALVLTRQIQSVCGVIDNPSGDGSLVASICLVRSAFWYSEAHHYEDLWSFVHPDHRKGHDYAQQLLRFIKAFGDRVGEPVFPGVLSSKQTLGKIRFYSREFQMVGALFGYGKVKLPDGVGELRPSARKPGEFNVHESKMSKLLEKAAA